jgi:hypothetical protein
MPAPFDNTRPDEPRRQSRALASRRDFLKSAVTATVVVGASAPASAAETTEGIPSRALGRKSIRITRFGTSGLPGTRTRWCISGC